MPINVKVTTENEVERFFITHPFYYLFIYFRHITVRPDYWIWGHLAEVLQMLV